MKFAPVRSIASGPFVHSTERYFPTTNTNRHRKSIFSSSRQSASVYTPSYKHFFFFQIIDYLRKKWWQNQQTIHQEKGTKKKIVKNPNALVNVIERMLTWATIELKASNNGRSIRHIGAFSLNLIARIAFWKTKKSFTLPSVSPYDPSSNCSQWLPMEHIRSEIASSWNVENESSYFFFNTFLRVLGHSGEEKKNYS